MYTQLQKKDDIKSSAIQKKPIDNKQAQKSPSQMNQLQISAFYHGKPSEYSSFFNRPLQSPDNQFVENDGIEGKTVQLKSSVENKPQENHFNPNNTGIPTPLKNQFEAVSGFSFDDVRVHYNSDKPAHLQALAYTQGNQVYLGRGQEKHLKHELGHVVQQKQGIVKPTQIFGKQLINSDRRLESEADSMLERQHSYMYQGNLMFGSPVIQMARGIEIGSLVLVRSNHMGRVTGIDGTRIRVSNDRSEEILDINDVVPFHSSQQVRDETKESILRYGVLSPKRRKSLGLETSVTTSDSRDSEYFERDDISANTFTLVSSLDTNSIIGDLLYSKHNGAIPVGLEDSSMPSFNELQNFNNIDVSESEIKKHIGEDYEQIKSYSFILEIAIFEIKLKKFLPTIQEIFNKRLQNTMMVISFPQHIATHSVYEEKIKSIEPGDFIFILHPSSLAISGDPDMIHSVNIIEKEISLSTQYFFKNAPIGVFNITLNIPDYESKLKNLLLEFPKTTFHSVIVRL